MGQYWMPVNLDKKEFVDPHKLGSGLKLVEQLGTHVGTALIILTAAYREHRGGGDLDLEENWHGPERTIPPHNTEPGPMPEGYPDLAKQVIGRWAGDRIAIVGDYAEDSDLPAEFEASKIWDKLHAESEYYESDDPKGALYRTVEGKYMHERILKPSEWLDVTDHVCKIIEHELRGTFSGDGWRDFKPISEAPKMSPDFIVEVED